MKEKLIELLGLETDASDEQVIAYVGRLQRIANSPGAKQEKAIREKMAAGLSRENAMQVLEDQAADDLIREEREAAEAEAAEQRKAKEAGKKAANEPAKPAGTNP